jgi:glycosyltransferase involved in cell wall biosynthesis
LKLNAVMRRAAEYMLLPFEVLRLRRNVSVPPHAVVLIVNGGYPGSYLAIAAALAFSRTNTIVMNVHSFAAKRSFPSQVEQWVIDRRVKNAVNIFIGVSEMSSRELQRRFGKYGISTATVYNSIEPPFPDLQARYAEIPRESNHVVLGLVGTLEPRKGHVFALEVLAGLCRKLPSVKFSLRFIGSDPYCLRHIIEREAKIHGVLDSVIFHGFQESKDSIYSELDLVLVPSRSLESFGLVAIESLSRGIPVVASASGALPEILEGIPNSEIVETLDAEDWVATILRLLSATPPTTAAISTSKLLRFSDPEQMADEYVDILKSLRFTS